MNGETKKFRIIVSVVLAILVLWTGFVSVKFFSHQETEKIRRQSEFYNIYVCGTPVAYYNAMDVLGDGTVQYDQFSNMLTLTNATLESSGAAAIFSEKDLTIVLEGENKIICASPDTAAGIYASDLMLRKDLSFLGDGTLTIEGNGGKTTAVIGIVADDIWTYSDISIELTEVAEGSAGIECSHLAVIGENNISVKIEGIGETNGIFVWGDVCLLENTTLDVTNVTDGKECRGIECTGSFIASEGSTVSSSSGEENAGILCHGVFFDYGATVNAVVDSVDGIRYGNGISN